MGGGKKRRDGWGGLQRKETKFKAEKGSHVDINGMFESPPETDHLHFPLKQSIRHQT